MTHTCNHIYDTGGLCQSFAVKGQRYCIHHLRYRARRLRAAQYRARGERFAFHLPPLDSMHDVHSALSQLAEAIAAGVIDRHSANALLSVLRVASRNLLHPEKWQANLYHSDQPAPDVDVAAEYGLPAGLDLDAPPDVAFPPSLNEDPGGPQLPEVGNCGSADAPAASASPTVKSIDPFQQLNCLERVTPIDIELEEIRQSQGNQSMLRHANQLERNELRRKRTAETRAAYQRYAVVAFHRNLERLAEKLANEKLARMKSDESSAQPYTAPKPQASAALTQTDQDSALTPTG